MEWDDKVTLNHCRAIDKLKGLMCGFRAESVPFCFNCMQYAKILERHPYL